jgi:hypothetical protein
MKVRTLIPLHAVMAFFFVSIIVIKIGNNIAVDPGITFLHAAGEQAGWHSPLEPYPSP